MANKEAWIRSANIGGYGAGIEVSVGRDTPNDLEITLVVSGETRGISQSSVELTVDEAEALCKLLNQGIAEKRKRTNAS